MTVADGQLAQPGAKTRKVMVLPGDDAAPEAVRASMDVLEGLDLPVEWVILPDGETFSKTMDDGARDELIRETADACDTALFGATSGKTAGVSYLRWGKDTYANVRPIRWMPGYSSPLRHPEDIDYVIVRENIEDLYLGLEGDLEALHDSGLDLRPFRGRNDVGEGPEIAGLEGRYAIKVITRKRTERVARFACELAVRRREEGYPGKVTCSAKYNVLSHSDGFFRDVVAEVAAQYDVGYEEFIIDDFSRRLVASPGDFDVVLLPNLYGDILSDEGAGTIGGLGVAPSGCYGDGYAYFEPSHGTAPDIAGLGVINPLATLLSAAMMLRHLELNEAADRLENAAWETVAAGTSTLDLGGKATTDEFARAIRERL